MSWSLYYASREAFEQDLTMYPRNPEADTDAADQIAAARSAAIDLIDTGAFGGLGRDYAIVLSGHSNPDHAPRNGYANDCVTVSVSQLTPVPIMEALGVEPPTEPQPDGAN